MQPDYDATTALIVVDVQNDFADPAGSLSVAGGAGIVPYVNAQIAAALDAGAFVAYTQDWHPPSTPHFVTAGGPWPVHCVAGTWGAALHPALTPDAGPSVRKGAKGEDGYSGFSMRDPGTGDLVPTELAGLLRAHGTRRVVVCGLATDYCVRDTALDALALGYPTSVLVAGVRGVDVRPGDGDAALARLVAAGATLVSPTAPSTTAAPVSPAASAAPEPVA
jgi:nicotinamidase/pyrazinamidase